jgi:hypothetical protein
VRTLEQKNDELEESARRATSALDMIQAQICAALEENEFLKTDLEEKALNEQHLQEEKKGAVAFVWMRACSLD